MIGNVKEIIAQATANQDQYMFEFDRLSQYMFNNNVPQQTVDRVKQWCQHTWKTQKSFNELGILEFLPIKMRTDLALDVHYQVTFLFTKKYSINVNRKKHALFENRTQNSEKTALDYASTMRIFLSTFQKSENHIVRNRTMRGLSVHKYLGIKTFEKKYFFSRP